MNTVTLTPSINELTKLLEYIHDKTSVNMPEIDLIVEEIFVNIVYYSKCTYIRVNFESCDESFLKIEFIDDGVEFNPLNNDPANLTDNVDEREIGGLGIHLVKNFADEIDYEYENKENHLKIIKNVKKWNTR